MDKFKPLYLWLYNRQIALCKILFLLLIPTALSKIFADLLIVSVLSLYLLFSYGSHHKWWEDAET